VRTLELWQTYSREEVHDIFSPDTVFTGTWGIQGIIKVPDAALGGEQFEVGRG
jgi:hypothetical protein